MSSLAITGEKCTITKNGHLFQSQALFGFAAKTCFGTKVDKYDCRALLTENIGLSSTSQEPMPKNELQMNRFSSLLLCLGEGSSEADILEWSSTSHRSRKTGSLSRIISPTAFEIEKESILENSASLVPMNPECSLPRMSNDELDRIASKAGLNHFSKQVFRAIGDSEQSHSHSRQRRGLKARPTYATIDDDTLSWDEAVKARDEPSKVNTLQIEIETSPDSDMLILQDHLSQAASSRGMNAKVGEYRREATIDVSPPSKVTSESDTSKINYAESLTHEKERKPECERQNISPPRSPRRHRSPPRSPIESDRRRSRDYRDEGYDRRRGESSPPRKKPKYASSSSSSASGSKLDRMLAQLEAKHGTKR